MLRFRGSIESLLEQPKEVDESPSSELVKLLEYR